MASRDVLAEALKLPTKERGRIVHELIRSLEQDEADDPSEIEQAWAAELEQRAARVLRGETSGRDLHAVCDELEAKRPPKK